MADATSHYEAAFAVDGTDPGLLHVVAFELRERLSTMSCCTIELTCPYGALEPRAWLGKQGTLVVSHENGLVRRFHGQVACTSERATTEAQRQVLTVVLRSALELLEYSSDRRVFLDLDVKEIVTKLLVDAGVAEDAFAFRLSGTPAKRSVCTYAGSSVRAFVEHLLSDEGIFWFVEHGEDGPIIVFGDSPSAYPALEEPELAFAESNLSQRETVTAIRGTARARPSRFTLRDHDFERPALSLEAVADRAAPLGREHYEFPAHRLTPDEVKRRADNLARSHVTNSEQVGVDGSIVRLIPGHRIKLTDTPEGQYDREYVVVDDRIEWRREQQNGPITSAELLPADQAFAPLPQEKSTPVGELAMVVTAGGEEIHCDKHGRIKVQYQWDRYGKQDEQSSGWVRVGQMQTSGSLVIPRQAWEVMLEFEDGDVDRPIVLGRLYNAAFRPIDALPGGKTNSVLMSKSSPGGGGHNEVRMNDGGGGELVNVHAQKDLNLVVASNKEEKVTTSANVGVTVDHKKTVGGDETVSVGGKDKNQVGGAQSYSVSAARTLSVTGEERHDIAGARSVTIGASHTTLTPMSVELSTKSNLTETVGGLCLDAAALEVGIAVAGTGSVSVGGAKIEAVATGKDDMTLGAKATTIGGAFLNVTPKDVSFNTKGVKVTTVGGAWLGNAAGAVELSSSANVSISVGGAIAMNAAKIVFKVGGSTLTIAAGGVVLDSSEVKITASGPFAELGGMIGSKG